MIPYVFHPDAEVDLVEAALFYETQMAGLGKSFSAEVERTIALIRTFPDAGSPLGGLRRRVLVDRFPFAVVYDRKREILIVVAVAHQRRRPGYWQQRRSAN